MKKLGWTTAVLAMAMLGGAQVASAKLGMPPMATQDETVIQVKGGGHGHGHGGGHHGWHGNRGHHYGWYIGRGNRRHHH